MRKIPQYALTPVLFPYNVYSHKGLLCATSLSSHSTQNYPCVIYCTLKGDVCMEFLEQPHLSVADLEKRWHGKVSRKTLYQWAKSGKLPPRHCIGSVKFWTLGQIKQWEAENIHPDQLTHASA